MAVPSRRQSSMTLRNEPINASSFMTSSPERWNWPHNLLLRCLLWHLFDLSILSTAGK
jgi:hypothetical protein